MTNSRPISTARQFAFVERLTMAKERLLKSIVGLSQPIICNEKIWDGWTIKDSFGFVVTWNEEYRHAIRAILAEDYGLYARPELEACDWNELRIEQKRGWTWKRVRADLERDCAAGLDLILSLRPRDFKHSGLTPWTVVPPKKMYALNQTNIERVETLLTYQWRHMNYRALLIEKWRDGK